MHVNPKKLFQFLRSQKTFKKMPATLQKQKKEDKKLLINYSQKRTKPLIQLI